MSAHRGTEDIPPQGGDFRFDPERTMLVIGSKQKTRNQGHKGLARICW